MVAHLEVGLEVGQGQVELLEQKTNKAQLIPALRGIPPLHPGKCRHEGGFRFVVLLDVEVALSLQVGGQGLPLIARLKTGNPGE